MKMSNAEYQRHLRAEAVARGLCLECRKRTPPAGVKTCDTCRERRYARSADRRARGLCECGRAPDPGLKSCAACRESIAARRILERAVRRSQGLCSACSEPALPGLASCERHLRRVAGNVRRLYRERLAKGNCIVCDQPNPRGTWRCEACSPRVRKRASERPATESARRAIAMQILGATRDAAASEVDIAPATLWRAAREHVADLRAATERLREACP